MNELVQKKYNYLCRQYKRKKIKKIKPEHNNTLQFVLQYNTVTSLHMCSRRSIYNVIVDVVTLLE